MFAAIAGERLQQTIYLLALAIYPLEIVQAIVGCAFDHGRIISFADARPATDTPRLHRGAFRE
ncbi:hypothetical protein N864_22200 [Intrasporangium chromatireducens Q5-1]|uniref:Uncharacterized protein n=1 Tax=Intrasporangium chromatireducens Q5-1 TaxID=584657 RepID=W9GMJ9_9MICO|nr:hypothetical protein N864_22200 [Intrasporangium chromatireducens Q5-1]